MRVGICILLFISCTFPVASQEKKNNVLSIPAQVFSITEVMYHDVVNPTAAARFYAYSVLTGYEILCGLDSTCPKIQLQFKDYPVMPAYNKLKVNREIA